MKNVIFVLFALSFCFITTTIHSQNPNTSERAIHRIGLQTGMNFGQIKAGNSEMQEFIFPNASNKFMGNFGFFSETGKSEYLVTQIGLFYQGKGVKADDDFEVALHYFQVPLRWTFRIPVVDEFRIRAGFGGYVAYSVFGKATYFDDYADKKVTDNDILGWRSSDLFKPLDLGVIFGGGFEYILPNKNAIVLSADYQLGTYNIMNKNAFGIDGDGEIELSSPKFRTGTLSISVNYLFDLSKKE